MLKFIVITVLLTPIFCASPQSSKLLDQLLDRTVYDPRVRPLNQTAQNEPTIVSINMYIRSIEYICTQHQAWKVQVTFRHEWNDNRLRYGDDNGRIKYINMVDVDRIWTPDTFFSNSRSTERMSDLVNNVLIRIYPNGNVLQSTRLQTVLSCPMDLKYYPFDRQTCSFQMASYGFTTDDVVMLWRQKDPVQITKNLHLADFQMKTYDMNYCTSRTTTGEYSCLKLDMLFKRVTSKYICQWFAPTAVLTFISFISFWLRPKSTRIRLLIITLILLYLHILYINNKASTNTSYSSSKDRWLSACFWFVVAAIAELAIVKVLDRLLNRKNGSTDPEGHNEGNCEKGNVIAMKPLIGKSEGLDRRSIVQKWRESSIGRRIDFFSAILFPIGFIVYIICFFSKQSYEE